jgi:hypothetical protein
VKDAKEHQGGKCRTQRAVRQLGVRFSGGWASPRGSTTGHLSGPYALLAAHDVHVHRHVSVPVVSAALAARRLPRTARVSGLDKPPP